MYVDSLYHFRIDIYIIFFWVKCYAALCIFKQENLSSNHCYYTSVINKLFLTVDNPKRWARSKMVQNEGLNLAVMQLDVVLNFSNYFLKLSMFISTWNEDIMKNHHTHTKQTVLLIDKTLRSDLFRKTYLWK